MFGQAYLCYCIQVFEENRPQIGPAVWYHQEEEGEQYSRRFWRYVGGWRNALGQTTGSGR